MSLYATAPLKIPISMRRADAISISVIKDLPKDVTRTFGGRVGGRKKRPKDIKVYETRTYVKRSS